VRGSPAVAPPSSFVVYIALTQPPREGEVIVFPAGDSIMVKFLRALSLLALIHFCQPESAHAFPVTINVSGTLSQATFGGCAYCGPYSAIINFSKTAPFCIATVEIVGDRHAADLNSKA
jgi:hypothetical protein